MHRNHQYVSTKIKEAKYALDTLLIVSGEMKEDATIEEVEKDIEDLVLLIGSITYALDERWKLSKTGIMIPNSWPYLRTV